MTTPNWAVEKIQEAKKRNSSKLILSPGLYNDPLTELPNDIGGLANLIQLDLSGNRLKTLPNAISQLYNLKLLDLSHNSLSDFPEPLTSMAKLSELDLWSNQLSDLPDSISRMKMLNSLFLGGNKFSYFPDVISELDTLKTLFVNSNKLSKLPKSFSRLQNIIELNLGNNEFTELPEPIIQLKKLRLLNIKHNELEALPDSISRLQELIELRLNYNKISELTGSITKLKMLKVLELNGNRLTKLPETISELKNLTRLSLEGNPLKSPPPEVVVKGVDAVLEYFRQIKEQGEDRLYEAKLLILGEGGAGKTSLAKKIDNPLYKLREEKSTEGVDVITWLFPVDEKRDRFFRVNIWDFGGQEIYHATHQFFLTKRSMYIIVADTRKDDTDFYYWLNVVGLLSDNSPTLIIKNEKQDRHREINERQLKGQFGNLKEVLATNLLSDRGLGLVRESIKHYIKNLPHIGSPLPKTWVHVREILEKDSRNHISLDEYLNICRENGFSQTKNSLQLSDYLHDLGVFLHFQDDPLLKRIVILKPKWGTEAVYKVLDNKSVIENLGRFTHAELDVIWSASDYEDARDELLQLMMKFKLCYEIPNQKGAYIAPQLLTENQPEYEWPKQDNLLLRYTYEFMPKGILLQFIVLLNRHIAAVNEHHLVWRSGVVIAGEKTAAEVVEHYNKRQIHVRVVGAHKKELMTIIIHELDKIHDTYKRLKFDKLIPCNCKRCKTDLEPHFYKHEQLQNFIEKRVFEVQCGNTGNMVDVRGLIDDIVGYKSEKEVEELMAEQKRSASNGINVGDNFSGTIITGTVKNSFNKIESSNVSDDLKETLKQLVYAVEAMNKTLPDEQASDIQDDLDKLVEEATKDAPKRKWYSVSIDGLTKAAENLGKVGEPVVKLAGNVLKLLAAG